MVLFQHLPIRRVIVIDDRAAVALLADAPAQAVEAEDLGTAGRGDGFDDPVPGVEGVGDALIISRRVAVVIVRRRGGPGDGRQLVLRIEGAGLGRAIVGKAEPVAGGIQAPGLGIAALGKGGQLVEDIVGKLLAQAGIQGIAAGQAVAVPVVGVEEVIGHRVGIRVHPTLFHYPPEAIQARVLIAAVGVAAGDDIRLIDPRLRMGTGHDGIEAEIAVGFQGAGTIRKGRKPADPVIDPGIVVVVQDAAIGIGHAHQPAVVGAAARAHEAIGILHTRRRGGVDGPRDRLVLRDQLAQAIVEILHLVDNRGAAGVGITGVQIRPASRIVGRGQHPHRAIHAGPQRGHRIGGLPAQDIVGNKLNRAASSFLLPLTLGLKAANQARWR